MNRLVPRFLSPSLALLAAAVLTGVVHGQTRPGQHNTTAGATRAQGHAGVSGGLTISGAFASRPFALISPGSHGGANVLANLFRPGSGFGNFTPGIDPLGALSTLTSAAGLPSGGTWPGYASGFSPFGPAASMTSSPGSAYSPGLADSGFNPYPYYSSESTYGGYLRGTADVINAHGRFLINKQQAQMAREAVQQARIDTRRKALEQYLWERSNLPTIEDDRQRLQALTLRRSLNDPPATEVFSAAALNSVLADLQKRRAQGEEGADVPLDEDTLRRINVTAAQGRGNAGLLKAEGKLSWPAGLRELTPERRARDFRDAIDSLLPEAVNQATNGRVDASILRELEGSRAALEDMLVRQVSFMPVGTYIDAKRFLSDLDDAISVLRQPDAGEYLSGKYAAKGKSVRSLAEYMTQHGLQFAPAFRGDEAAYAALHKALVRSNVAARNGSSEASSSTRNGDR